jgi:hypothetical protein
MMPPWTTYRGDQHIAQGFEGVARYINEAQRAQQQQQQFDAGIAERRRATNLGFYTEGRGQDLRYAAGQEELAKDWYGLQQRGTTHVNPLPQGGSLITNPGTGQFQYLDDAKTQADASPFGIVFDANGNVMGERAMPLLDPQGNVIGNKAVVGGKETVIKPQGENIGTAIGKALGGGSGAAAPAGAAPNVQTSTPPAAPALSFKSADEVKQAVREGRLSRDGALKVLRQQFGMQ